MRDFLINLLGSGSFIPHGHCYLWKPGLVWLHLISDAIIALAYYSIPLTLFYFVRKRQDLPFSWIFLLFAGFIISCGTTHIAAIWTLWHPTYWLSGIIKSGTAIISLFAAIELIPLVPQALALPSPNQLRQANEALQAQIEERLRVENELRGLQDELEQRVQARTAELVNVNQQLQQEIDERHRAEAALRVSRERLVLAQQVGKIGTYEWNVQTQELIWTEEMEALFGLAPGSFEGSYEQWLKRLHPDDRPSADLAARRTATEGADFDTEFRIVLPDGTIRWVAARAKSFYDGAGKPDRSIGVNMDITDRQRAQEALRKREQRLDLATSAAKLGVFEWNVQADCAVWENPQMYEIFGHALEDGTLNKEQFADNVIHPEDREAFELRLAEGLRSNNLFHAMFRIRRRNDGQWRWVEVSGQFELALDGTPLRLIGVLGDITDRKQTEQEREQLLEREQAARVEAETANRIKDEFLAVLSHELRSPLNPILGWVKLLRTRKLDEQKTAQALETIERNASLQTQLIGDLLDVSRILQGKLSLNIAPVDLAMTVRAAMETVQLGRVFKLVFVLEQAGANAICVASAGEALQVLARSTPDILLSDIGMAKMDGYTLMRRVRAMPRDRGGQIRAIALTAYAGEMNQQQALRAGFQLHLSKPVEPETLIEAITSLLQTIFIAGNPSETIGD